MADFYDQIGFTATGDARAARSVNSNIQHYAEWVSNLLFDYGYVAENVHVQAGTPWGDDLGWGDMTVSFNLNVLCGRDVYQIQQNLAIVLDGGGVLTGASVRASQSTTEGCPGSGTPTPTPTPRNNPPTQLPPSGGGGNNNNSQKPQSSFDEFTTWIKAHETEAMAAGLLLLVVILRK